MSCKLGTACSMEHFLSVQAATRASHTERNTIITYLEQACQQESAFSEDRLAFYINNTAKCVPGTWISAWPDGLGGRSLFRNFASTSDARHSTPYTLLSYLQDRVNVYRYSSSTRVGCSSSSQQRLRVQSTVLSARALLPRV